MTATLNMKEDAMKTIAVALNLLLVLAAPTWAAEDFTGTKEVRLIHGDLGSPKAKIVVITDILGADISWVQQQEAEGVCFSDHGNPEDILAILKDHGFNWIRLRVFHNPKAEKGYSKNGYCDLDHTLAMAKRIKAAGLRFLLDFHYSDTWADPGHQIKPAAWVDLHGADLERAVHDHTRDVVAALKRQGTPPTWCRSATRSATDSYGPMGVFGDPGTGAYSASCSRPGSPGPRKPILR